MFHHNTELVLETWRRRRGVHLLPARASLPDAAMTALLPQTFILGESDHDLVVRLCGGRMAELFCGDLTGKGFLRLFPSGDAERLADTCRAARRLAAPFVFKAKERGARNDAIQLEIFLGPLATRGPAPRRWLGHVQNLNPYGAGPCLGLLETGAIAMAADAHAHAAVRLVALNGARVA